MKLLNNISKLALMAAVSLAVVACGGKEEAPANGKPGLPAQKDEAMVIRYVDADSLMKYYNLAKDFEEASTSMQNKYDNAQKAQQQKIQSLQNQFAQKEKNNVYATNPQQAQADQAAYQKAMSEAQSTLAKMQEQFAKEEQANQKQLNDSVNNYLKEYAKQKGYDMILNRAATFYVDPKFDVTTDVVKGLNARYTKVAKKK